MIPYVEIAPHIVDLPRGEVDEMNALIIQLVSANKTLCERWPFLETVWTLPLREQHYHIERILERWDITSECDTEQEEIPSE